MVESTEEEINRGENALETVIQERLKGIESGSYRRNIELVLAGFADWLGEQRDVITLKEIAQIDRRRNPQQLRDRANDPHDDLTARSTETYYAYVRAFVFVVCS